MGEARIATYATGPLTNDHSKSTDSGSSLAGRQANSESRAIAVDESCPDACDRVTHAVQTLREPLVRYAAYLLGGDVGLGQDVAQDTFGKLLQKPPQDLDQLTDDRLKAWLFTVCRNRALDLRRKQRRMTTYSAPTLDQQQDATLGPADLAQKRDTLAALLRKLATLPSNQQEVIRLRFQGEMTYSQIAEVTELTRSNVGYLLHHGLKTLRTQMSEA